MSWNRYTLLTVLILLTVTGMAFACPSCKDSIPNSDAEAPVQVGGGINASVYVMLGGLFSVMGWVTFMVVKAARTTPQRIVPGQLQNRST